MKVGFAETKYTYQRTYTGHVKTSSTKKPSAKAGSSRHVPRRRRSADPRGL